MTWVEPFWCVRLVCGRRSLSMLTIRIRAAAVCDFVTKPAAHAPTGIMASVRTTSKGARPHEDQPRHLAYPRLRLRRQRHERARARLRYARGALVRDLSPASRPHERGQPPREFCRGQRVCRRAQGVFLRRARVRGPLPANRGVLRRRARQGRQARVHRRARGRLRGRRGRALVRGPTHGEPHRLHARGRARGRRGAQRHHQALRDPARPLAEGQLLRPGPRELHGGVLRGQAAQDHGRGHDDHPRGPAPVRGGRVGQGGHRDRDAHRRGGRRGARRQHGRGARQGEGRRRRGGRGRRGDRPVGYRGGDLRGRAGAQGARGGARA